MIDDEINGPNLGRAGNHVAHGGFGGLKRVQANKELVGLASLEERNVEVRIIPARRSAGRGPEAGATTQGL